MKLFLITYFSNYDDREDYAWYRTEEGAMEFVETCKELGNKIHKAMEIIEFRDLNVQ